MNLLVPRGLLIIVTRWHLGAAALADWWYLRDATQVAFCSPAPFEWICRRFAFVERYRDGGCLMALQRSDHGGSAPAT